jgi:hypothetical protein
MVAVPSIPIGHRPVTARRCETYHTEQPSQETPNPAEDGQDTADDSGQRCPERNLICNEHPLRRRLVRLQRLSAALAQDIRLQLLRLILQARQRAYRRGGPARAVAAVQPPYVQDIEVVVGVPAAAIVDRAVGAVAGAVVPEVDLVHVAQQVVVLGHFKGGGEGCAVGGGTGPGDVEAGEVGLHEVELAEGRGFVPSRQLDEDEADEGGDGQRPGREDTRYPRAFAHAGVLCCVVLFGGEG